MSKVFHPGFEPSADHIFIHPIPRDMFLFLEKVWFAFVNKVVSLTFIDGRLAFEHSVFEVIDGDRMRISVSSSQTKMKKLVGQASPKEFRELIARVRPVPMDDPLNMSAAFLRRSIIDLSKCSPPPVADLALKKPGNLHPDLTRLLTPSMNYGVCVPLFTKGQALGMLWGIHNKPLSSSEREEIGWQFQTLHEGIDNIVAEELDCNRDDYIVRRAIEKIETNSRVDQVIYRRQGPRLPPVKSLYAYSYRFKRQYRMDSSWIVPLSEGFSISLKQYLPHEENRTGVNLLMIPGFFCNRSAMDRLARQMALGHGFKVFALNIRGRGRITLPPERRRDWTVDDYIWKDFPAALRWIRDHFPDERTVVVGHSMGGMIPKFYAGSYDSILAGRSRDGLPDPNESIAGIVSLSSPSYVGLDLKIPGIGLLEKGAGLFTTPLIGGILRRLMFDTVPAPLKTVDLNHFFTLLGSMTRPSRMISYNLSRQVLTIKDFVGYRQISPPEWYFLMEDVFCRESLKVVFQFVHSQLADRAFMSFDGNTNYTEGLSNLRLPVHAFFGENDTLAPPDSIRDGLAMITSQNKKQTLVPQGHLGIIMHPETVRFICEKATKWIEKL